jgi:hypothetical protein
MIILMNAVVKTTNFTPIVTISNRNLNYMFATIKDQSKNSPGQGTQQSTGTQSGSQSGSQSSGSQYPGSQKDSTTQKPFDQTIKPDQKNYDKNDQNQTRNDQKDQKEPKDQKDQKDQKDKKDDIPNYDKKE